MEKHYVYRIEDITTGEFYWGVRTCKCEIKDDSYMGSMKTWKPNKDNLIKTNIIEYSSRGEANKAEDIIIRYYWDKNKFPLNRNYNANGKFNCYGLSINLGNKKSIEERIKMSERMKGKEPWNRGIARTDEVKEKLRQISLNYKPTEQQLENLKIACSGEKNGMYGKKHSEETKDNMRTPKSEETKLKLSLAKLNNPKNKGYRLRPNGKYESSIKVNSKSIYLGTYKTEEEAKQAYINAKIKYYNKK